VDLGLPGGHVGSRCMVGAVGLVLPLAMLIPKAWQELWARVYRSTLLVPGTWCELWARGCQQPCWFLGHSGKCASGAAGSHVASQGMAGVVGPGLQSGHVCSQSMAGAVGPGLSGSRVDSKCMVGAVGPEIPGGHVCSRGMVGAVGLGLPVAILVLGAWRELWAQGCYAAMLVSGA